MFKKVFAVTSAALLALLVGVGIAQAQPTNPARILIGQATITCRPETTFHITIVDAVLTRTIVDYTASDDHTWAVAVVDVTNLGTEANYLQALVKVRDERGREFYWVTFHGPDIYVEDELAAEYEVKPSWEAFEPGITERTVIPFEIADDARSLTLLPDPLSCTPPDSAGTAVSPPVTGGAREPATLAPPAVTAVPQHPAASLGGQSVTACKFMTRFRFTVVGADWRTTIVDRPARSGAMWAVVVVDITNLSRETDYAQGRAQVQDERGRTFAWRLFNGLEIYVEDELAAEYDVSPSWEGVDPGIPLRTVLIFEVAADARSLTLLPDDLACDN